jgi:flagellar biosynthesis chaperone FliJ
MTEYPEAKYLRDLADRFESPMDANSLRAVASTIDVLNRDLNAARVSISETQSALEMWKKAWREEDGFGADVMGRLDRVTPRLKISGALYSPSGMLEALDALIARANQVTIERDRLKEDLSAARQSLYEVAAQRNELHATLQKLSIDGVSQ